VNKYTPDYSTKFRRNRRSLIKRGYDMSKLESTIDLLLSGQPIPPEYRDHPLNAHDFIITSMNENYTNSK